MLLLLLVHRAVSSDSQASLFMHLHAVVVSVCLIRTVTLLILFLSPSLSLTLVSRNKIAVNKLGAFPALLRILESGRSESVKRDAAVVLANCADIAENQTQLVRIGALQIFARHLIESPTTVKQYVLLSFISFYRFFSLCLFPTAWNGCSLELRSRHIAMAVGNIVTHEAHKAIFCDMGGLAPLIRTSVLLVVIPLG